MAGFNFTLDSYDTIFQTQLYDYVNNHVIKADIEQDFVLSLFTQYIDNSTLTQSTQSMTNLLNSLSTMVQIQSCSKKIDVNPLGYQVHEASVTKEYGSIVPNVAFQDFYLDSYKLMLDEQDPSYITEDFSSVINQQEHVDLNQLITDKNSIITVQSLYTLFHQYASILEHLKILQYSFYFKSTSYDGYMSLYKCQGVFPDLPSKISTTETPSYYSAVLVSPFAQHNKVQVYNNYSTLKHVDFESSFNCQQIAKTATAIPINSIGVNSLIYTMDDTSDDPTFDLQSDAGSNGFWTYFRNITTNTYNLTDKISEIFELFNIKQNTVLTSKNVKLAILYLIEMWHHNIQVYQCDFYACHYNCHVNSFENSADVTDRIPTRFVFNIKCQMDYDTVNSTTLKNLITMPEYQNKYVFSYTGPIVAGGSASDFTSYIPETDAQYIQIPYPYYSGDQAIENVFLTATCTISRVFNGSKTTENSFIINIPDLKEISIGNTSNNILELSVEHLYWKLDASTFPQDIANGILSCAGDIDITFGKYDSESSPYNIAENGYLENIPIQQIYPDTANTTTPAWFNPTARGNAVWTNIAEPKPNVYYKFANETTYTNLGNGVANFSYSWKFNQQLGKNTAVVTVIPKTATATNPKIKNSLGGQLTSRFEIVNLTRISLTNVNVVFSLVNPDEKYVLSGKKGAATSFTPEIQFTEGRNAIIGNAALEQLFAITYINNDRAGKATIHIEPNSGLGSVYFLPDTYAELTFTITNAVETGSRTSGLATSYNYAVEVGKRLYDWDGDDEMKIPSSVFHTLSENVQRQCLLEIEVNRDEMKERKRVQGIVTIRASGSGLSLGTLFYQGHIKKLGDHPREIITESVAFTLPGDSHAIQIDHMCVAPKADNRRRVVYTIRYNKKDESEADEVPGTSTEDVKTITITYHISEYTIGETTTTESANIYTEEFEGIYDSSGATTEQLKFTDLIESINWTPSGASAPLIFKPNNSGFPKSYGPSNQTFIVECTQLM